jgi:hypothetical protein
VIQPFAVVLVDPFRVAFEYFQPTKVFFRMFTVRFPVQDFPLSKRFRQPKVGRRSADASKRNAQKKRTKKQKVMLHGVSERKCCMQQLLLHALVIGETLNDLFIGFLSLLL